MLSAMDAAASGCDPAAQLEALDEAAQDLASALAPDVVLSVRDQGPGITVEELPRIFDRFYRGGGRPVRGQAGTGLGLAIAKGLVEAMGGRIWVGSRPGRGATFSFALPAP